MFPLSSPLPVLFLSFLLSISSLVLPLHLFSHLSQYSFSPLALFFPLPPYAFFPSLLLIVFSFLPPICLFRPLCPHPLPFFLPPYSFTFNLPFTFQFSSSFFTSQLPSPMLISSLPPLHLLLPYLPSNILVHFLLASTPFFVTLPAKYPQSTPPCWMMYPSNSEIRPFSIRVKQIQFLDEEERDCDWRKWKGEEGRGRVMCIS